MALENNSTIISHFETGDVPTATQFKNAWQSQVGSLTDASLLEAASIDNVGCKYIIANNIYECQLVSGTYQWVVTPINSGSVSYPSVTNKPSINGNIIVGALEGDDIGLVNANTSMYSPASSLNGDLYLNNNGNLTLLSLQDILPHNVTVLLEQDAWVNTSTQGESIQTISIAGIKQGAAVSFYPKTWQAKEDINGNGGLYIINISNGSITFAFYGQLSLKYEAITLNVTYTNTTL